LLDFNSTELQETISFADIVSVQEEETNDKVLIITTFANRVRRKGCCCTRV
jgi:hypothetical protein